MFVISTYSRRQGGHVVAFDLLAVVADGEGRLARRRLQEAGLDPFSVGGRLAEDFGGYLVTDGRDFLDHADDEIEAGVSDLVRANADLFGVSA